MRVLCSLDRRAACGLWLAMALVGSWSFAEPPAADSAAVDPTRAREAAQAIASLDDNDFAVRTAASDRLERLVEDPSLGAFLAEQFARVLEARDTSLEARTRIEALARQLPAATAPAADAVPSPSEIIPLLDKLNGDSSAERDRAMRALKSMLNHTELIAPLWLELKRRAAEPALSVVGRRTLEPLLDRARQAWALADPAAVPLPPVSEKQISRWIDELADQDDADAADRFRVATAHRELKDLIVRDDTRPVVLQLLAQRIAESDDAATAATLQQIADYAKPAMAAEVWGHQLEIPGVQSADWEHRQHMTVQHLIVGVPQIPEGAQNATHFDRIDDRTAHCVSGNSLKPGEYPVGIAIPNPDPNSEIMYHLINLPTPRRQLIYEYRMQRDEVLRLKEISQRTCDHFLGERIPLGETQVLLLAQLDPHIVSRFVGPYFQTVDDVRLISISTQMSNQLTVHSAICYMMTRVGTRHAVPALEQLARSDRLKPSYESPFRIAWIAALAIAMRDPWPEVDAWLASLIDEKMPLITSGELPPELGASAAALLLDRHGASTRPFGLETAGESVAERFRFAGYRFTSNADRDRRDVKRWWDKQKNAAQRRAAP